MKTLSEELREEQYAIPGALGESSFADWADRAAALEAEVERLRDLVEQYELPEDVHAENTALKARHAEAVHECREGIARAAAANTTPKRQAENTRLAYTDMLEILAPEGEGP